jgi:hypothetical protein
LNQRIDVDSSADRIRHVNETQRRPDQTPIAAGPPPEVPHLQLPRRESRPIVSVDDHVAGPVIDLQPKLVSEGDRADDDGRVPAGTSTSDPPTESIVQPAAPIEQPQAVTDRAAETIERTTDQNNASPDVMQARRLAFIALITGALVLAASVSLRWFGRNGTAR